MGEIIVKEKDVVVPGEIIAKGMDFLPGMGTTRQGDNILAARIGLVNIDGRAIRLIPLSGQYLPRAGDTIIANVVDVNFSGWRVETNSAYSAMLNVKDATSDFVAKGADLTQYFDVGDYLVGKIVNVTTQMLIDISLRGPGLRKLGEGRILKVASSKVPRIIGKKGSMVSMIKQATDTKIIVGQNGVIWISGEDPKGELIAVNTIKKIEEEAHIPGLTDRIKSHLEQITGRQLQLQETPDGMAHNEG
ncbi:RNA-binding protein [Candidatus Woesearchaeota archaeon]|nr:RNA-binding protein [Candidatus Woesearchaeota archaeon]